MSPSSNADTGSLKILHCFRSPVGGIFRHVRDLITQQVADGHRVGIVCDNSTGGTFENQMFAELQPTLELGLERFSMGRAIGLGDLGAIRKIYHTINLLDVDVIHSHGAKGGAYARLAGKALSLRGKRPALLYCPHGGSIHYDAGSLSGRVYFALERMLERFTDHLIFVSEYERDGYLKKIGTPRCSYSLAWNGLNENEFIPVESAPDASDFLYIGMMRDLKGVDLFLEALPRVAETLNRTVSATLVGDGPDLEAYKQRARNLGNSVNTRFIPPTAAREAFSFGEILVVPSRAESFPYIVLEGLAAEKQMIATRVGGIPEIFGEHSDALVQPDDAMALAASMVGAISDQDGGTLVSALKTRIRNQFSAPIMAHDIMAAYRIALNNRKESGG